MPARPRILAGLFVRDGDLLAEFLRQGLGRWVIEDSRSREPQSCGRVDTVAQLDGGQRVEPQLQERRCRLNRLGLAVAQYRGYLTANHLQHCPLTLGVWHRGQSFRKLRPVPGANCAPRADGQPDEFG